MTAQRIRGAFIGFIIIVLAGIAAAQETTDNTTTAATGTTVLVREVDSHQTRGELNEVLRRLPPEVGKVLKLDPTLWANPAYLGHYPSLAAFVAQHPEVVHSPRFFLEDVYIPGDALPEDANTRFRRDFMESVTMFGVLITVTLALVWLIRTLVEQRRWSRVSRVQAEVHSKLVDRFASNEDLLKYVQTEGGKRFLEASPILPADPGRPVSAPIGRILWSVQVGLVIAAFGIGLKLVGWSVVDKGAADALSGFGVLGIAIGIGFVASAAASYVLSRRLGLWEPAAPLPDDVGR
jgi:small-conductance mechanosensitive channel